MNKLLLVFGLLLLLFVSFASAQTQEITMKTSDFFIVQFDVANVNGIDLRNCVPYLKTSDYVLDDYTVFSPEIFDLPPGSSRSVNVRFDGLPEGFYSTDLNVKCERYDDGVLVDVANIINPRVTMSYELLVSPPGVGQDYVFVPVQHYFFLSNGGEDQSASFSIANTGDSSLSVDIVPAVEYQDIISVTPRKIVIPSGSRQSFKIVVDVPVGFDGLDTNLSIRIGDYTEYFAISGSPENSGVVSGAVAQNLFNGQISAGTVSIPTWIVVLIIIVGGAYLVTDGSFFKKKFFGGRKR